MTQSTQNFNFERCEDEPIHIPESVQSYGFLIAFNYEDLEVSIVSENCNTIFADEIIGKGFLDILSSDTDERAFLEETFDRVSKSKIRLPIKLHLKASLLKEGAAIDYLAVVYDSGCHYVVELEPATEFRDTYSAEQFVKLYSSF